MLTTIKTRLLIAALSLALALQSASAASVGLFDGNTVSSRKLNIGTGGGGNLGDDSNGGSSTTPVPLPLPSQSSDSILQEWYSSWALFIYVLLLIGTMLCSYFLQLKRIRVLHESVISIFAGMIVGFFIRVLPGTAIQQMVSFKYTLFFNLLLPPIILNSGYEMHQSRFFSSIGTILVFAFIGTFISAIVIGVLLRIWSFFGWENLKLSLVDALSVGATLSATDPVSVLAIFKTFRVDPQLYAIIFGESMLNDAVSIIMFETLQQFRQKQFHLLNMASAVGLFLVSFVASLAIGVAVGIATALVLKHSLLRRFSNIETCVILLMAYGTYLLANGLHLTGIVSLLFCGITLKHYAYYNMSRRTQLSTRFIFQALAALSENFIFIYLGVSLFTEDEYEFKPFFIMACTISVVAARYCAVFPISQLINRLSRRSAGEFCDKIPRAYQMMLFWAGLRGAVGVALSAGLTGPMAKCLKATVSIVVIITVVIFGGTISTMLELLNVRTNVAEEPSAQDDLEDDEFDIETPELYRGYIIDGNSAFASQRTRAGQKQRQRNNKSLFLMDSFDSVQGRDADAISEDTLDAASSVSSLVSDLPPLASNVSNSSSATAIPAKDAACEDVSRIPPYARRDQYSIETGGFQSRSRGSWFSQFDDRVLKPMLLEQDKKPAQGGRFHR